MRIGGTYPDVVPSSGYVKKYNSGGKIVWERRFAKTSSTDASSGVGLSIALQKDSTVVVSGAISGGTAQLDDFSITASKYFLATLSQQKYGLLTVLDPNGGTFLESNSTKNILWQSDGIQRVNIKLNLQGHLVSIADNIYAPTGTYTWTVPDVSGEAKIVIEDAEDPNFTDASDTPFAIGSFTKPLQVLSPDGWETLRAGSIYPITWQYNSGSPVAIEYTSNNGATWQIITESVPNLGSYNWTVPFLNAENCKIRVRGLETTPGSDESDFTFRIVTPDQFSLLTPNGGEILEGGSQYPITWQSSSAIKQIHIQLSYNGQLQTIATNVDATLGQYNWSIPFLPSKYSKVIITDAANPGNTDSSDQDFLISKPKVKVLAPNWGETYLAQDIIPIRWTAPGVDSVKIEYKIEYSTTWVTIGKYLASDGTINWTAPNINANAKIRVSSTIDRTNSDESDGFFSIRPWTLKVTTPATYDQLVPGTVFTVKWETNKASSYQLYYSTNGGQTWETIHAGPYTGTSYQWLVPNKYSSNSLIRVVNSTGIEALSDRFTIKKPLTVVSPNGGETLTGTSTHLIKWSSNAPGSVNLYYTLDGGTNWIMLASSLSASVQSYFNWTVPNSSSTLCKIKIENIAEKEVDISDANFTIVKTPLKVVSPNGGEVLTGTNTHIIRWNYNMTGNVNLHYTIDGGNNWVFIANVPAAQQQYTWSVPNVNSSFCKIQVTDLARMETDVSDANFTIKALFRVSSPTTSTYWGERQSATVKWEDNVFNVSYNIDFNEGWGTVWRRLKTGVLGNSTGVYSTSVTAPSFGCDFATTTARIRITRVSDGTMVYSNYFETEDGADPDCNYITSGNNTAAVKTSSADMISTADAPKVQLYPNPTKDNLTIQLAGLGALAKASVEIYDLVGKQVLQKQVQVVNGQLETMLNVSNLKAGTYIISLTTDNQAIRKVFMKE